ncbi:MAG: helix-turn-helix transcriptional regulator [Candidatus Thorarchaeota archaeon]|nr:helix-turn-helix transcriptional regulator [Candidatus Thorarchaeota archaeon]
MATLNSQLNGDTNDLEALVRIFKALSDQSRLRIIALLAEDRRRSVSEVANELGMSISSVSHHLSILGNLGFVGKKRNGKRVYHSLDDQCVRDILKRAIEHVSGN